MHRSRSGTRAAALGFLLVLAAAAAMPAGAQAPTTGPAAPGEMSQVLIHPWVVPPPGKQSEVYFTNLKDGDSRESPFVLRFGLSMRGLAPAGTEAGIAGHHHLLINYNLPLDFKKPLPFSDQYIHYGKGEMQTVIDLKPGTYQFNLVLADKDHIPYYVFGKPVRVTITKQNKNVNRAQLLGPPRVEIMSPAEGEKLTAPFRVQFHASAYNVAHENAKISDAGHFRLTIEHSGKAEVMDFKQGQTEVWLNPPRGSYTMKLDLLSNVQAGAVITSAPPVKVTVAGK